MIDVLNRGIGGQEAPQARSRFESDVIVEAPGMRTLQSNHHVLIRFSRYSIKSAGLL
jgi:acyl-CoA thioesterase-1